MESGRVNPSDLHSAEARLRSCASRFPVVEVDSSYYGLPSARKAGLWARRTPEGCVLDVKAFRLFTRFGHIDIAGHGYDADVIIFPDPVQASWSRREGHRLAPEGLRTVLAEKPEVLVIGTGYDGRMQLYGETVDVLRGAGIDVRVATAGSAVAAFNRLQGECARVVAALHLTR
ncbi:MAG: MTH938/NDUFAF3 family protein [Thiocapsa sp.]|nr:MTH938/NDUFAF3 family protein [Thiocapsa sp.]MCG6897760.1 MTH938/NDUFAF3 family protein [Thiocapsa sp.]